MSGWDVVFKFDAEFGLHLCAVYFTRELEESVYLLVGEEDRGVWISEYVS